MKNSLVGKAAKKSHTRTADASSIRDTARDRDSDTLPEALRDLLIEVRAGLKELGDDGAQGSAKASVDVQMGWAEIRAVYALFTRLVVARKARDEWQRKHAAAKKMLGRSQASIADHDLLNNRAVVSLLVDIENVLSGAENSPTALFETHKRVQALVARARRSDRRHSRLRL